MKRPIRIGLFFSFSLMLAACAHPRYSDPTPYVAIKGKPYYWEVNKDRVYNCSVHALTEGHGYQTESGPCRIAHNGNFNAADLKGARFSLLGRVIMESTIPLWGPFGPYSSYDKRRLIPVTVEVMDENNPILKKCKKVNYEKIKAKSSNFPIPENAAAYDCSKTN